MKKVYHYTTYKALKQILADNEIKVSETERKLKDKHPSAWFSANPFWEPTASKIMGTPMGQRQMNMEEQHRYFGCARISINYEKDLITWAKYRHVSGLPIEGLNIMEYEGEKKGAKRDDWFASFTGVKRDKWIDIEVWTGDKWIKFDESAKKVGGDTNNS